MFCRFLFAKIANKENNWSKVIHIIIKSPQTTEDLREKIAIHNSSKKLHSIKGIIISPFSFEGNRIKSSI